ncbi:MULTISPECIES: efflux RND transporter periplasmic adaptor subunit [Niastella]|uniref:Efflux RND transporter periplasmic adaptor subunit n=1 Tax=Niastella soli TaxID=2821487 RepID=A0ABS3YR91_9BACT|nr:efflux RND transporter periplasmic adaptor subunit [Niastella soli]MBO9200097.1 efflux RND transporter periplasmic adaptor subunit [Niastella soli]
MKTKKYKWLIWVLVIVAAGVGIWFWKFREKEKPVVLETEQPYYGTIATSVTATGTVQPVDTVSVGTQVSGTISKVYVDFNDKVKKGQLIAEIDKTILSAQRDQISANLRQARANQDYQKSNFDRQKQLLDVGAISRADYEIALNQFNASNDNVSGIAAQLKAAQQNLYYANIYSPIDGTVLTRNVSVGQTVAASLNTPTLFVIAKDLTKMQVQAAVDEADIGNVKNGQRVTFTVDAFPDNVFEGHVNEVRLRPSVSSNVVTYSTIIDAPNGDLKLKPGMTANITVFTQEISNALLVSAKAIRFRPDSSLYNKYTIEGGNFKDGQRNGAMRIGSSAPKDSSAMKNNGRRDASETVETGKTAMVWVKKDSTLTRRKIKIGLTDDTNVQVLAGLTTDDVVVSGSHQLETADKGAGTPRSPFMPQRRGGGSGGNRGGGGGTGGNRSGGSR